MDKARNLYGTTSMGGASGFGAVYKVDTSSNETVLHSFTGSPGDGATSYATLIMDKAGNLYGTTAVGGANGPPPGYGTPAASFTSTAASVATGWSEPVPERDFHPLWTSADSNQWLTSVTVKLVRFFVQSRGKIRQFVDGVKHGCLQSVSPTSEFPRFRVQ